ncbi:3-hydroxyacyl-CoA dehydrogenase /Enoyl-CoA hydratase [Picrophilus oshimae DSM 9789]|uniref:3-hydroxyacyl-CoA dehydrogenase /Enoyl-CoA hydratase n=2 Tax=Picrophilus oshimae TaxID=46632 RepID=A0A8G2FXH0_PICTO|nr:3-hydroxyacyl-CoA dehydrogenase /Enoyl-CoA hydratase [Picrophilus oshimae DSM 9789]
MIMIKNITVIGAGLMGHGIGEVFALNGYNVNLYDSFPAAIENAKKSIDNSLSRLLNSGKIKKEDLNEIKSRIKFHGNLDEALMDSDFVIEAVPERLDIKTSVLSEVSKKTDSIIATNTSSIRISEIAEHIDKPERFLGMHFFNPPVVLKLVEVIRGEKTAESVFNEVYNLAKSIKKIPIKVMKDTPGFVVNRISGPETLLFCFIYQSGLAKPEEVDSYIKAQGMPMGPYELFDYVGLDVIKDLFDYYGNELSQDYKKCTVISDLVNSGKKGMKTGQGFYKWENGKALIPRANPSDKINLMDIFALEINEAVKLIEDGVATPEDIETGVKYGLNRPFGPISVAEGLSNREVKDTLLKLYEMSKFETFKPAKSIDSGNLKAIIHKKISVPEVQEKKNKYIIEEKNNRVLKLLLNNGKNNLITKELVDELNDEIDMISKNDDINVVVITGRDTFSAGADLSQFFRNSADFMKNAERVERVFDRIRKTGKIFIAAIKGYALGGGLELALACDIRMATRSSILGFPETSLGLIPGYGGSQRLYKLIGMSRAVSMILTAERITGERALDYGIVNKLFENDDEVMTYAVDLSERIAPVSVNLAKKLIYSEMNFDSGLDFEAAAVGVLYSTDDLREGISAFLSKRKPDYKGH